MRKIGIFYLSALSLLAYLDGYRKLQTVTFGNVSIRSTPYCIAQKNVVPLHGGIIFLILIQEYAI